jgi:sensor c-di-GMP phosphodiesterase-like protein
MSVQSQPLAKGRSAKLSDAVHVLAALAAGLVPLMVFAVLSHHQTVRRAQADLTETVEVARQFMQDLLQQAELELTRFVQITDGRVTPESKKLLREIVYTNPYFREAGIIDEQGFLVHSTAAEVETPIEIPPDQRSDASVKSMQIVGLVQTSIMREKSIVLRLSTRGQGEVNVLVDPGLLTLLFRNVELGPEGRLLIVGPGGRTLNVLSPLTTSENVAAVEAAPNLIRVTRAIADRQIRVVGVLAKSWALREWYAHLLYSLPLAGLCSAIIAFVMIRLIRRNTGLDHDLRLGIGRDELKLEYQPIIDLDSGRCVAAEALLRWQHPVHGRVRPDLFIPLAEDTGLIGPLTEWVVRRVLLEQEPLLRRFPDLRLSINCPTSLLVSGGLEQILRRVMVAPQLATNLVFEVTEHVFVGHGVDSLREAMSRLRRAGFRFALDDFGTGYSSFGHLAKFEFEFLKIDRSFVQAIGASEATTSIFDTLVDLAATLGIATVAEGVETDEQRRHVKRRGVSLAQGWLFGMPVPSSEFAQHWSEARSGDSRRPDRRAHAAVGH